MASKKGSWLDFTDDDYNRMHKKWEYTKDVDTLEYADRENVKRYLLKRAHWEKKESLETRIAAADPNMDFSLLMGKIVGQAHMTEDDDTRQFEKDGTVGLGDVNDEDTPIGKIWKNADGEGTNYPVLWRKYARKQLVYQWMYVLVDGLEDEIILDAEGREIERKSHEARIKLIEPYMVLAKDNSPGLPSWMKVKHRSSTGGVDWTTQQEPIDYYTVYHHDGWQRFRKSESGTGEVLVAEGSYEFYTDKDRAQRCLPIFLVKLPFEAYIAHYLARKSITIFNQESQRDKYIAEADVHLVDEGAPVEFEARKDDIAAGETHHNVERGTKAYYISPPSDPANLATEVIDKKRQMLWESAYQMYGDAAKESTATEIRQEARSGIEAFLRQLVTTFDEAENQVAFLLEQIYFPNDTSKWGAHKIERSKKFSILDPVQFASMVMEIAFGANSLPMTDEMVKTVTKFIWEKHLGFVLGEKEEAELDKAVKQFLDDKLGTSRNLNLGGDGFGDGLSPNTPEPVFEEL